MDEREYFGDDEESLRSAWAGVQKHMWSSLVCIVAEDSDGKTLKAQSAIKRRDTDQDGNETFTDFPLFVDVPVHFAGGGGCTFTHPIKKGDECLVVFTSRPHDSWFQSGGPSQQPVATRMHSLSDGMALVGFRSMPRALDPPPSTVSSQMRSDDGHHFVDLNPQTGITHKSSMQVTLDAPQHTIKGALTIQPTDDGQGGTLNVAQVNGVGGTITAAQSIGAPTLNGVVA